jgi:hypothetical protein
MHADTMRDAMRDSSLYRLAAHYPSNASFVSSRCKTADTVGECVARCLLVRLDSSSSLCDTALGPRDDLRLLITDE